ncbi:hypothetical protein [Acetobacter malorum]|uniref:hypothetical protein n=1 Tax=Acetobacter malorum TaxID=178901 RepID=UPI001FCA03F3|nr:hypothetical protein [Acetobacter malorum]
MLLGLGIVLGFASIGFLCWLLFLCAVYAAPLFVSAIVCTMLYDHGVLSGGHAILASSRDPALLVVMFSAACFSGRTGGVRHDAGVQQYGRHGHYFGPPFRDLRGAVRGWSGMVPALRHPACVSSRWQKHSCGQVQKVSVAFSPRYTGAGGSRPGLRVGQCLSFCERSLAQTRPE